MVYKDSQVRTLRDVLPELQKYLQAGLTVLDVGCGLGSISLDVAQTIQPGKLMGIDINSESVGTCTALSKARQISNVNFKVMDAHKLIFDDNIFDLVYSYTVTHFWLNPTQVMRELKRVAKPGARVVTGGIRDYGFIPPYPDCPNYGKVWNGISASMEAYRKEKMTGTDVSTGEWDLFWNFYAGRKCVQWYVNAGFDDLEVYTRVEDWWYPGSEGKDTIAFAFINFHHKFSQVLLDRAIERGYLDRETADKAIQEMKQWEQNPYEFYYHPLITIIGRA